MSLESNQTAVWLYLFIAKDIKEGTYNPCSRSSFKLGETLMTKLDIILMKLYTKMHSGVNNDGRN